MQSPAETIREALARLDACARAYADACVAHEQASIAHPGHASTRHMLAAHDALMQAARAVAALE